MPALALDPVRPRMLDESAAQLVAHLSHQNGWWRDTAQQLLVQRQDKSVVPALQNIVRTSEPPSRPAAASASLAEANGAGGNLVARFHALWTLEGLNALDLALVREQMKDSNPRMRVQAIRASETLYKASIRGLADDYRAMTKDNDPDVAIQALLTANLFKLPEVESLIKETMESNKARGVQEIGQRVLQRIATAASTAAAGFSPEQLEQMKEGETVYKSLCATCHGEDARGVAVAGSQDGSMVGMMGPALAGSPRVTGHRDYVIKTLLHGMTGPLAGRTYTQVMLPMGSQTDQWIANVGWYIRNEFGNTASFIAPAEVASVRAATAARKAMWTYPELEVTLPRLLPVDPTWKAMASHNTERAPGGLTLAAWTTATPQAPDMWYQVELPQAAMVTEVQFDAGAPGGGGRGRGGRGAVPAGAAGAADGRSAAPAPAAAAPAGAPAAAQRGAGPSGGRGGAPVFGSFPIAYKVQLSMDGKTWGAPVAQGTGSPATIIATFRPVQAKFVRVTQTGSAENAPAWSVLNFRVYAAGGPPAR